MEVPRPLRRAPNPARLAGAAALTASVVAVCITAYFTSSWSEAPLRESPPARLALAAVIGAIVTAVHVRVRGHGTVGHSLARAQTLLCVAGALTMILIDNSVARAFGIAGAASIVRFRTPVDDPTDATVLFLLLALGMASGVGSFGIAVAGAMGVCLLLVAFRTLAPETHRRQVTFELVGTGDRFPTSHVNGVLLRHGIAFEPAEWSQDTNTRVRYRAAVDESVSLETLGAELKNGDALQSVTWEVKKSS